MKLNYQICKNTNPQEKPKVSDGGGLSLEVIPKGGKLWCLIDCSFE